MRRWYCIQAKARQEFFAYHNLVRQGFKPLLLTDVHEFRGTGRSRGPKKTVRQEFISLFGPYFFIPLDLERDHWKPAAFTYGVRCILGTSPEAPSPIDNRIIEGLLAARLDDEPDTGTVRIHPGCHVRVIEGPMQNQIGICKWSSRDRVKLLLEAMSHAIVVEFNIKSLELVL